MLADATVHTSPDVETGLGISEFDKVQHILASYY